MLLNLKKKIFYFQTLILFNYELKLKKCDNTIML